MKVDFLITENRRLDFRKSYNTVHRFIRDRLNHFGFRSVRFCEDRIQLEREINKFLKNKAGFIVTVEAVNPILDLQLVRAMIQRLSAHGLNICISDGAIPGTQPEFVLKANGRLDYFDVNKFYAGALPFIVERWHTQARYNNQFNLNKYKRLKMFLDIVKLLPDLHKKPIDRFCAELRRESVFRKLITYFTKGDVAKVKECLHCRGVLKDLPYAMSQPFCGYLSPERPCYYECRRCGLILLSPIVTEGSIKSLYDDFDREDFITSLNNPYKEGSPRCDFSSFISFIPKEAQVLDLGGGVGKFSEFLKMRYPHWNVTHSDIKISNRAELESKMVFCRELDLLKDEIGDSQYDLITAWEVVEHLPFTRFGEVLGKIHTALKPGGAFVFSTPDFDSPLCKSFDFFGACPPFHFTVFSTRWLRDYFSNSPTWRLLNLDYNSDLLDDAIMWFDYTSKTSPSFQLNGLSLVLKEIFKTDLAGDIKKRLLEKGYGTEVIVTLMKR